VPRKSKKSQPRQVATPAEGDIFEHFQQYSPGYGGETAHGGEQRQARKDTPDISALMSKIEALERDNQQLRLETQRALMTTNMVQPAPQRAEPPKEITLDLSNMPDPVTHTAEYQAELARRTNAVISAKTEMLRQQVTSEREEVNTAERLWQEFSTKHPEWVPHKDLVSMMATKVAQSAQARGIDPKRYLAGSADLFFNDLISGLKNAGYDRLLDTDEGEEEELEVAAVPRRQSAPAQGPQDEDEDLDRTDGIFGGQESGGKPSPQGQQKPGKGGMFEDLQQIQVRTGFF
jgi:hypothetical protein